MATTSRRRSRTSRRLSSRLALREVLRLLRRLAGTLALATLGVFIAIELSIEGGFQATLLPSGVNPESARDLAIVDAYNLDQGIMGRWLSWLGDAVQGDFGRSIRTGTPVWEVIEPRLPISGELMLVSIVLTVLIGLPMGVLAAMWANTRRGRVLDSVLGLSQAMPVFVLAPFLILILGVRLQWLPAATWVRPTSDLSDHIKHLILPVTAVALTEFGAIARIVQADLLRTMSEDYVIAARGKGLSDRFVLYRHALRPSSFGLLNIVGLNIGAMLSGVVVVELIFGIGGLGQLLLESTINRDLNAVLALTAYFVVVFVVVNWVVDMVMLAVDPRIDR